MLRKAGLKTRLYEFARTVRLKPDTT